ncbi:MAG: choline-sulfatase [Anaerolineae bacterium]|nr:choline-sulfatase [Anaerolineae bacterium]
MTKPNILLIMADQLIPMLMGAYDHPVVQTPNLNQLVEGGIRFDAAYSPCPLCAPARAALLTGTHTSHNQVWDNAAPLASDFPTMAHYLTNAGYDTVTSGKMHYVGADQLHGLRRRLTTDVYPSGLNWLPTPHRARDSRILDRRSHANGYKLPRVGVSPWTIYMDYDEETQFRALQYLNTQYLSSLEGEQDPFFLCVSFHHPHDPFKVPQDLWDLYEGKEITLPEYPSHMATTYSEMDRWLNAYHGTDRIDIKAPESLYALRRAYYGLVTFIDRKVGELMKTLDKTGLRDNTVIIFTSDHGDMLAEKNMVQKRSFYEFSSRVPLIINMPDGSGAGTRCTEPVSLIDIAPTLFELAGIDNYLPVDGQSLLPYVASVAEERVAFSESHTNGVYEPCFMVRKGPYKYIFIRNEEHQLFDLENDPGEWHNLIGHQAYTSIAEELRSLILDTFNPDAVEQKLMESLLRRAVVKQANEVNEVHWDYAPFFDVTQQYAR